MNDTDSGQEAILTDVLLQAGKETWRGCVYVRCTWSSDLATFDAGYLEIMFP